MQGGSPMPDSTRKRGSSAGNWLCAALLFVLLTEWLRPLYEIPELTEMYQLSPFMAAIGGFLLLHVLGVPFFWSLVLHAMITVGVVAYFFYGMWMWEAAWWHTYLAQLRLDLEVVLSGRIAELSGENRTVLFLTGWGMILYAVYTIMAMKRQTAWFVIATIMYLFVMQGWLGIDTTWGIVRAATAGMLLQMVLTVSRANRQQGESAPDDATATRIEVPGHWLVAATLATCVWLVAVLMLSPVKPDTLTRFPFPEAALTISSSTSPEAWTGYSGQSDLLGSPVKPDSSIAFKAATEQLTYWRGDVRYTYTGSGWADKDGKEAASDSVNAGALMSRERSERLALRHAAEQSAVQQQEVWLQDRSLYGEWFSGGAIVGIAETTDENGEAISKEARFAHYKIQSIVPPTPDSIRSDARLDQEERPIPLEDEYQAEQSAREKQLAQQLPADIPVRVANLAAMIIGEEQDSLHAAELVRDYLRREYAYTMSETARPSGDADFVDHFLFEQRQGYCDHFSTAMTVMLRTAGIPARWVMGYAPGEMTGAENGTMQITVRQSDAHSWVEVWDEQWGWVPYEPTPAYAAELAPEPVMESDLAVPATAQVTTPELDSGIGPSYSMLKMAAGYWLTRMVNAAGSWNWWALSGVSGIGGAVLMLLVRGAVWVRRTSKRMHQDSSRYPADSLEALQEQWLHLERRHGGRRPAETLLEFVDRIPTLTAQERKRWISLAEQLYRLLYQDASRSAL